MTFRIFASVAVAGVAAICLVFATAKQIATTAKAVASSDDASISGISSAILGSASIPDLAALASAAIIMATAFAAAHRFEIWRESKPHLTLQQSVYHQPLGDSYRLVAVITKLTNGSKVLVSPETAWCRIFQTAPVPDDDVMAIYINGLEQSDDDTYEQYGWWELDIVHKHWLDEQQFTVEPNESANVRFQFIIRADVAAVAISTAIIKPGHRASAVGKAAKCAMAISTAIIKPGHGRAVTDELRQPAWTCYSFLELPTITYKDAEVL